MAGTPNGASAEPIQNQPAGTPPAVSPAAAAAAPAAAAATTWYSDFKDADLKGYAELNKWASPEAAARDAREAQKLIGVPKDELVRLPKDLAAAKPEELAAVYDRLGRPKSPDDYGFKSPDGNDEFAKAMAPVLHQAGLSVAQGRQLETAFNEFIVKGVEAQEAAKAQEEQVQVAALHNEWPGQVFDQRQEMARRAVGAFVMPHVGGDRAKAEEMLGRMEDSLGTKLFLKIWSDVGEKIGEGTKGGFVEGNGNRSNSGFGLTPAAAHEQLQMRYRDAEWAKKAMIKGSAEDQEFNRLSEIAAQGRR